MENLIDLWNEFLQKIQVKRLPGFPVWSERLCDLNPNEDLAQYPTWKQNFIRKNNELYINNREFIDEWIIRAKQNPLFFGAKAKLEWQADILIEINIANEETKFGIDAGDTIQLVREIAELPNIHIKGLMTIAPFVENPEDNRLYFRRIHQLSVDITKENIDNVSMDVLSMGMTGDYMVAIEEGATMVRVGTGIFGERNYNK